MSLYLIKDKQEHKPVTIWNEKNPAGSKREHDILLCVLRYCQEHNWTHTTSASLLCATIILGQSKIDFFLQPCISPSSPGMNQPAANPSAQIPLCDNSALKWFLAFPLFLHSYHISLTPSHPLLCKSALHQWKFASLKGSSKPQQLLEVV